MSTISDDFLPHEMERWESNAKHKQLVLDLCDYLNDNHAAYFARPVTPQTLKRWVARGLCELNETSLEIAIYEKRIPPKSGRPKVQEQPFAVKEVVIEHVTLEQVMTEALKELGDYPE